MGNAIELKNVSFTYKGFGNVEDIEALSDVSLTFPKGSFTAILGHNGSGKSTLANIMCMLAEPDHGELWIDGKLVSGDDVSDEDIMNARRHVGIVFQNPDNQIVATVVEEDVAFGCENLGMEPSEIRRRVDQALDTVGMRAYARHSPHRLSGGQKQRVAIAGIIAMRRDTVIFDESTAMLDPMGRREVMETIERLNREEGMTVVLITHYMDEAARADRIAVMNKGSVLIEGSPSEVFSQPEKMWDAGLDVPQTTELLYKLRRAGLDVRLDIFDPEECADEIAAALSRSRTTERK